MARVDILINGRTYPIACDDGQEDRVRDMAAFVDDQLGRLRTTAGSASDMHLMIMVSLMLADQLFDAGGNVRQTPPPPPALRPSPEDPALAIRLGKLADVVEGLAERVRHA